MAWSKANAIPKKLQDIVISYAARVETRKPNPITGMFGGYPSVLNITSYDQTRYDYIHRQNRPLKSYRLRLSQEQKRRLIYRILEDY